MKIIALSVGKKNDSLYGDSILEFSSRIERYASFEWKIVSPSGKSGDEARREEESAIIGALKEGDYVVLLDERGKEVSTIDFSTFLEKRMIAGDKRIVFIIGGAFGVSEGVRDKAHFVWSLSKLVFPHQLVRVILAEQLYRGFSVVNGEKYHHI
jgi:23S rRNA (pseudouridine1915-N3)-methyltransferase